MHYSARCSHARLPLFLVSVLIGSPGSQCVASDAIIQLPAHTRMISYVELGVSKDRVETYRNRVFHVEDGRKRVEHLTAKHGLISIFDDWGIQRLYMRTEKQTASVWDDIEPFGQGPGKLQNWIEDLERLCNSPTKDLGVKKLDGRWVTGLVAQEHDRSFTIWVDVNSRSPVRIGIDEPGQYMTLTEFEFHQKSNESIFSFHVPKNYTVVEHHTKAEHEGQN